MAALRYYVAFNFHSSYQLTSKTVPKRTKCDAYRGMSCLNRMAKCATYSELPYMMIAAIKANPPMVASGGTMLWVESDPGT